MHALHTALCSGALSAALVLAGLQATGQSLAWPWSAPFAAPHRVPVTISVSLSPYPHFSVSASCPQGSPHACRRVSSHTPSLPSGSPPCSQIAQLGFSEPLHGWASGPWACPACSWGPCWPPLDVSPLDEKSVGLRGVPMRPLLPFRTCSRTQNPGLRTPCPCGLRPFQGLFFSSTPVGRPYHWAACPWF